jgi:hypothetical protein
MSKTHDANPADWLGEMFDSLIYRPDDIANLAAGEMSGQKELRRRGLY